MPTTSQILKRHPDLLRRLWGNETYHQISASTGLSVGSLSRISQEHEIDRQARKSRDWRRRAVLRECDRGQQQLARKEAKAEEIRRWRAAGATWRKISENTHYSNGNTARASYYHMIDISLPALRARVERLAEVAAALGD